MEKTITKPIIHINGTSATMLTEGYLAAHRAVEGAFDTVSGIEFNARDYYVSPDPDAWKKARAEHSARLDKLREVSEELNAIAEHCSQFIKD